MLYIFNLKKLQFKIKSCHLKQEVERLKLHNFSNLKLACRTNVIGFLSKKKKPH